MNEQSLLFCLRKRFFADEIYTNIGPILVSVNPFKQLPFYTNDVLNACIAGSFTSPHIFTLASKCYDQILQNKTNQSCIVTGESGAGKTEATKLIIQCITERAGTEEVKNSKLQQKILEINPLLEAFGNARTSRNDNSSRFGKLTQLFINPMNGDILGIAIVDYLLEKSRIVQQSKGERNYHIFYQLLTDAALAAEHNLEMPEKYFYLSQDGSPEDVICETINDSTEWKATLDSFETLGIDNEDVRKFEKVLIGILCLGNLDLTSKGPAEPANIRDESSNRWLSIAAKSLGLDKEKLRIGILSTTITARGESTYKNHTKQQAIDARDALAKSIYSAMFSHLIFRINENLKPKRMATQLSINVLDIFGFESFDINSFEQLCINYCNEKLQVHFIDNVFRQEEQAYALEGIKVPPISFKDTSEVLGLIEDRTRGIYALLDEQNRLPTGSDKSFLSKVLSFSKTCSVLSAHKAKDIRKNPLLEKNFKIQHFAGEVSYHVDNFLEKNTDKLLTSLQDVLQATRFDFVKEIYDTYIKSTKKNKSLGSKFQKQLGDLLRLLNASEPHFVRTIKPNPEKTRDRLNSKMVLDQIKCAGLLGVCEIHKNGYPVKKSFKEFFFRYNMIVNSQASNINSLCVLLTENHYITEEQWQIGKTKVFLRNLASENLENIRESRVSVFAVAIQRVVRGFLARKRVESVVAQLRILKSAIAQRNEEKLEKAINGAEKIKSIGILGLALFNAKECLRSIREVKRVLQELEKALQTKDIRLLTSLLAAAEKLNVEGIDTKGVKLKAQQLIEELKFEAVQESSHKPVGNISLFLEEFSSKLSGPFGITSKEVALLASMCSDLENTEDEVYLEAKALLDFAQVQLEVQDFVSLALESRNEEDILAAVSLIQQINLNTTEAKKVLNIVIDEEKKKQDRNSVVVGNPQLNNLKDLATSVNMRRGGMSIREKLMMSTKALPAKIGNRGASQMFQNPKNARMSMVVDLGKHLHRSLTVFNTPLESSQSRAGKISSNIKKLTFSNSNTKFLQTEKSGGMNSYDIEVFYLLRPIEKRGPILWSGFQLKTSLTLLNAEFEKIAIQLNRSILQYTGDEKFQYPASAAQKVLQVGIETPIMNNEVYLQIMRNIKQNRKPSSEDKSWILMVLLTQILPPTRELEPYLSTFLRGYCKEPFVKGNYAKLCLAQVARTLELGVSDSLPDVDLVAQYSLRPALLMTIKSCKRSHLSGKLADVSLPCYPDTDVEAVLEIACEALGINPNKILSYGLFIEGKSVRMQTKLSNRLYSFYAKWDPSKLKHVNYFSSLYENRAEELFKQLVDRYGPEPSSGTPPPQLSFEENEENLLYPIPWWTFPGDLFMKLSFQGKIAQFSVKKKLIFDEVPNADMFEQIRESIVRNELVVNDFPTMTRIAAIALLLKNQGPINDSNGVLALGLEYIFPQNILMSDSSSDLANSVLASSAEYKKCKPKALYNNFLSLCSRFDGYGVWFFPVTQVKSYSKQKGEVISALDFVGVSCKGLHLFNAERTQTVQLFPYGLITEYGADNEIVWFQFKTRKGKKGPQAEFESTMPWEIFAIVEAYIEFTTKKEKRPKATFNRYSVFLP